jgi:hypothetical protein
MKRWANWPTKLEDEARSLDTAALVNVGRSGDVERLIWTGFFPECVSDPRTACPDCYAGDPTNCPIRLDADYRSYLMWLYDRRIAYTRLRTRRIDTLKRILTRHKQPLHWEVIAKLALAEAPNLFPSPLSVMRVLYSADGIFKNEEGGVFGLIDWNAIPA